MSKRSRTPADFDSPWKEALERFLEPFLAFFFPAIHADIDWSRGYVSLDKEFQQIIRKSKGRRRVADKLFKVWLRDGGERWLLIHVEIQGSYEKTFPERMFVYNYRAYDLYNRMVVSLAVLCDERPAWRPHSFAYEAWGFRMGIDFPIVKLLDYAADLEALATNPNPFATVVLAHLKALETRGVPVARQQWKLQLVKGLYERNWTAEDVRQLFRLIDWIMELPEEMQEQFRLDVHRHEEEKRMPYLSSIERLALQEGLEKGREEGLEKGREEGLEKGREEGLEKGREEGLEKGREEGREEGLKEGMLEGLVLALDAKFGSAGRKLMAKIRDIQDVRLLRSLGRVIKTAKTLDEVREHLH